MEDIGELEVRVTDEPTVGLKPDEPGRGGQTSRVTDEPVVLKRHDSDEMSTT